MYFTLFIVLKQWDFCPCAPRCQISLQRSIFCFACTKLETPYYFYYYYYYFYYYHYHHHHHDHGLYLENNLLLYKWRFFMASSTRFLNHTRLDTPHSVGFLWTSDQPYAETSTWQHRIHETDIHARVGNRTRAGIRTRNPTKLAATGLGSDNVTVVF